MKKKKKSKDRKIRESIVVSKKATSPRILEGAIDADPSIKKVVEDARQKRKSLPRKKNKGGSSTRKKRNA